jgi:hypothetical protein
VITEYGWQNCKVKFQLLYATIMKSTLITFLCFIAFLCTKAQILTQEDSLNAGLSIKNQSTYLTGYGEALVTADLQLKTATADLRRNIIFFGHKFNDKIQFFSEMELEHAVVANESTTGIQGELAMEQLFLKFNLNSNNYIVAGLFIPRIGIINENHLPTTFNGNDRHQVEQQIIPSTWRELGIGLYSNVKRIPGLNLSCGIMNGLNSKSFEYGTGIRDGRAEGNNATASNIALTAAVLYYYRDFRIQASGYYGGTAGLTKRDADSLQLSYGAFGTPVALGEIDFQYLTNGLTVKGLASAIQISDAASLNRAYASNTPELLAGAFLEGGYNLLHRKNTISNKSLTLFCRYEWLDLNVKVPENGVENAALKKTYITAGINFRPTPGVAIKLDYVHRLTGIPNPDLLLNPTPNQLPYFTSNGFIKCGFAYSF